MAGPAAVGALTLYSIARPEPAFAKEAASVNLQKVRESIVSVIEKDAELRGDGTTLYGTMIRLAWHCCGTYAKADNS
jgi:catalase (peroxidase I)